MITQVFEYNQHFVAMMNIINAAKLNPPKEGHKHHIIPRCWFKMNNLSVDNSKDNLVLLSYEDHVKVHKLAYLCALEDKFKGKMAYAYHRLTQGDIVSNGAFAGVYNSFYGKHHTEDTKKKMKDNHSDVSGNNNPFYGKHHTEATRNNMSESHKGKTPWNKGKKLTKAQKSNYIANNCWKKSSTRLSFEKVKKAYRQHKADNGTLTWNEFQKMYKESKS